MTGKLPVLKLGLHSGRSRATLSNAGIFFLNKKMHSKLQGHTFDTHLIYLLSSSMAQWEALTLARECQHCVQ